MDKPELYKYKLDTILSSAEISENETKKIKKYISNDINNNIDYYKMIINNNKIIGILCVKPIKEEYLLDEIYLIKSFRNKGIGTNLIKHILEEIKNKNSKLYLWVYKVNKDALKLYQKLGFKIIDETETRYKMIFEREKDNENNYGNY